MSIGDGIELRGRADGGVRDVLTPEAADFVAALHREFNGTRRRLLELRAERQLAFLAGELPGFLPETTGVRDADWVILEAPADLRDRRVEITGPTDRKMLINALNSGARVFMADFEDANAPTWENMIGGQRNLTEAIERTIRFASPEGKIYRLNEETATLLVRPRGWHLDETHLLIDGEACAASLFDFGLYLFRNAERLLARGTGPYLYLPKLESHLEARLWNDVFVFAQDALGIARGTIRATVLIETILAAFEMEEILYELRDHAAGLNAGRWDYIFSIIKKFREGDGFVLPDRGQITMTIPFMRAYTQMLVKTCHRRGAFAIGGMAAYIPSRRDPEINAVALEKVREDKVREANDGFDGTWVAHPDLVSVAAEAFDAILGERSNQLGRQRDEVTVGAGELLDVRVPGGTVTEAGVRNNVSVALQYLESWLRGVGAVGIFNLMEDAATAEISRSQVWQWIRHRTRLDDGRSVTRDLVRRFEEEELWKIRETIGEARFRTGRFEEAREIFEEVSTGDTFPEFLTISAGRQLD